MGRNAPAPVATPLPPRKPFHIGKQWPTTAPIAANASHPGISSRATNGSVIALPDTLDKAAKGIKEKRAEKKLKHDVRKTTGAVETLGDR